MAKIDELHNYAYPNSYLDELHKYDKSIGNTSSYDEIHDYGNRGLTYGLDEIHLYGSYQTVDTSEDEANVPNNRQKINIDEYFDEIEEFDEEQKEKRKELAEDFKDILKLILALILADLRLGNTINEGFYYSLTKSRLMDAIDDKLPHISSTVRSQIEIYIDTNVRQVIDSTVRNQEDPYFFSEDRAVNIAVDDAMATVNLEELDEAIKAGYSHKIWVTMRDKKVRHTHEIADGQKVRIEEAFKVGRCKMQAPMVFDDESEYQDAKEVIHCRCFLIYSNKGETKQGVEQFRKGKTHRKTDEQGHQVISKPLYNKLTQEATKNGADIRVATPTNEYSDVYKRMSAKNGTAVTYGDTIFFSETPTTSDVLEELYHFEQNLTNANSEFTDIVERAIRNEIDAQKYLLSVSEKYKIPLEEVEQTKQALVGYEKDLAEYLNNVG